VLALDLLLTSSETQVQVNGFFKPLWKNEGQTASKVLSKLARTTTVREEKWWKTTPLLNLGI
jgi:hypothetical protein